MSGGNYSQEFKEAVLTPQLLPSENARIVQLANEYQLHDKHPALLVQKCRNQASRKRQPQSVKTSARSLDKKFNIL